MPQSRVTIKLAVGAVLFVMVAGFGWSYFADRHENAGHLVLLGNIDVRQVNLAFKVPGRLEVVTVEEGDRVSTGQLVAALEKEDFEDEAHLARSRVAGSTAILEELETGTRSEEIEQARALVNQSDAALELAQVTLKRQEELAARDFASHQAHDEAQARVDEAKARLKFAQQTLELAETGPRDEDIAQARAQLAADQAALSLAERRLEDASILAPNEGAILTRVLEPGAIVAPGETVYTLSLASPVWVRTYVEEPDLGRIFAGMKAEVHTDSGGIYAGQIGFISPVAEFTPKTVETRELRTSLVYRLRVIVDNPDKLLLQGMPVTVILKSKEGG